ncbi:tRNA pseudouridine(55) synthase TruB [Actinobaculum sp. 313]|uniref:tRNA pseudouridine(55) synthase TruB n=1 Tax=Actinobaculum sp. 313 TaxID=2495645 RepID=UPI000D527CCB|nr:tRNA pseudouridine(55) synthase TruB [Actinobaculum sp. 313]AWE42632.1 tRNA pseudouridine(55) synthase TruB [Actinobaculum sp. 313]
MTGRAGTDGKPRRALPWGELPQPQWPANSAPPGGLIVIDKPAGVTSHDVVAALRRLVGTRKVGHAGTLDPMATGVLCLGIGRATKLLRYVTGADKEYTATIRLGIETTSDDADGQITARRGAAELLQEPDKMCQRIAQVIGEFRGDIAQVPSAVSAIKVSGRRSYDLVRAGEGVELQARTVHVELFRILSEPRRCTAAGVDVVDVDVDVVCGAGTYVRALARDVGNRLGCGAHLTALRRVRLGVWRSDDAYEIPTLARLVAGGGDVPLVSVDQVCRDLFPLVDIDAAEAAALRHGQFISGQWRENVPMGAPAAAFCQGHVVALVSRRGDMLKPDLLLQP